MIREEASFSFYGFAIALLMFISETINFQLTQYHLLNSKQILK